MVLPPSWILSKCYILPICRKDCHRCYFLIKYGDDPLNSLKSYSTLSTFKMAVAAILDYVKMLYLKNFSLNVSPMLHATKTGSTHISAPKHDRNMISGSNLMFSRSGFVLVPCKTLSDQPEVGFQDRGRQNWKNSYLSS
jgi:hypothetical protein